MRLLVNLAAVFAIASCGVMNLDQKSSKPSVSEESAIARAATLPATAIVRVPVVDGKEVHASADLRTTNEASLSQTNIAGAFETAKSPEQTVDELDKTTSTESFCGWRRWNRCYNCGNYNYSYNYNWGMYSPTYYNYGYYYNYRYTNSYNHGGYNYYQYNSSFSNGYSGYGYAPGYNSYVY